MKEFSPQLGKLRAYLEIHPKLLAELDHPTWHKEHQQKKSHFFYHCTLGKLLFQQSLVNFLQQRLHLHLKPEQFEYYFTAYHNTTFSSEVMTKLGVMDRVRIGAKYRSRLNLAEQQVLQRDYYWSLLSSLNRQNQAGWLRLLTEQYFIHYLFSIAFPSPSKRPVRDWCIALVELRYGKDCLRESITEQGDRSCFKLCVGDEVRVELKGSSIKWLRNKGYKTLLKQMLDTPECGVD